MSNTPLSDILLKAKIFASKKEDEDLLKWIGLELEGYEDKPPKYRIINAGVKVSVFIPFRGTAVVEFPTDLIKEKQVSERLSQIPFHNSIAEIENLCLNPEESATLQMRVPIAAYGFMKPFLNGEIQDAYQYVSKAAVKQIPVTVKSLLIDYLLKISKDEDIDFNTFVKSKQIMITNNITAGIVNTGDGTINANGAIAIAGNSNVVTCENRKELFDILEKINDLVSDVQGKEEYLEVATEIKEELEKNEPSKKFLKRCFQSIPTLLSGVASGVVANQLTPYITAALALL